MPVFVTNTSDVGSHKSFQLEFPAPLRLESKADPLPSLMQKEFYAFVRTCAVRTGRNA
jgi:hypothetical protein